MEFRTDNTQLPDKPVDVPTSHLFVNDLPVEVLLHIFDLSFEDAGRPALPDRPLLCITHVCTLWRNLAIQAPRLWSHLKIDNEALSMGVIAIAELWLRRSQTQMLTFDLIYGGAKSPGSEALGRLLGPNIARCRSLKVWSYSDTSHILGGYEAFFRGAYVSPELEDLSATAMNTSFDSIPFTNFVSGRFPKLRSLTLDVPSLSGIELHDVDFPICDTLVRLALHLANDTRHWIPAHITHLLRVCPRLVDLELHLLNETSTAHTTPPSPKPVELPHLTAFFIAGSFTLVRELYNVIIAPQLGKLRMSVFGDFDTAPFGLGANGGETITTLEVIGDGKVDATHILRLLEDTPQVTTLRAEGTNSTNALLEGLTQNPLIGRHLQSIVLTSVNDEICQTTLAALVQSRFESTSCSSIKTLQLTDVIITGVTDNEASLRAFVQNVATKEVKYRAARP